MYLKVGQASKCRFYFSSIFIWQVGLVVLSKYCKYQCLKQIRSWDITVSLVSKVIDRTMHGMRSLTRLIACVCTRAPWLVHVEYVVRRWRWSDPLQTSTWPSRRQGKSSIIDPDARLRRSPLKSPSVRQVASSDCQPRAYPLSTRIVHHCGPIHRTALIRVGDRKGERVATNDASMCELVRACTSLADTCCKIIEMPVVFRCSGTEGAWPITEPRIEFRAEFMSAYRNQCSVLRSVPVPDILYSGVRRWKWRISSRRRKTFDEDSRRLVLDGRYHKKVVISSWYIAVSPQFSGYAIYIQVAKISEEPALVRSNFGKLYYLAWISCCESTRAHYEAASSTKFDCTRLYMVLLFCTRTALPTRDINENVRLFIVFN